MASTEVSASTLCNRCLDGLWGRKGWQELDPEGAIIIHESREPKYMKYEVTFDALRASAQQNCWWCELLYDHMLQYIPDHKPTDVLVIHLNLEIPENVQPVQIHSIHVSIGKKDGTDEEPVTWMSVGIFTKSGTFPIFWSIGTVSRKYSIDPRKCRCISGLSCQATTRGRAKFPSIPYTGLAT